MCMFGTRGVHPAHPTPGPCHTRHRPIWHQLTRHRHPASRTEEENRVHLEMRFERVQKTSVKLALDRGHRVYVDSVELFGFQCSIKDGNLRPAVAPREKLQVDETPTDRKTLKSFWVRFFIVPI